MNALDESRPILGVIADDLTGGMETASMLVAQGVACTFVTRPERVADTPTTPVIVVAQKTRVIAAADAVSRAEAAARSLLAAGVRQLFFKYCATFDSTDRGNIGPVAERLLDLTGEQRTAYCPSSAEVSRLVFNGHLFVGTQLVSESPKRFDPLTPMTDPDLVRVLQRQTKARVGLLPHRLVRTGNRETLARHVEALVADGVRHIITDAIYEEDLAAIAALCVEWRVMTGNSAIVQNYPALWRDRGWLRDRGHSPMLPAVDGPAVVLSGSCAERTLEQLAAFERHRPVLRLDITSGADVASVVDQATEWAASRLSDGPVAIATSASSDDVRLAQERLGRDGAAARAEAILGDIAVRLVGMGVRRLLVAGGETSGSVVQRLGVERLKIGAYRGPGVALATAENERPLAICLKSGKLGPVEMFLPTLDAMTRPEAAI